MPIGTYAFGNGDKYVGDVREGKQNGRGTYTFANGNKYVGEFKGGKFKNLVGINELVSAHFEFPTAVGGGTAMTDVVAILPDCIIAVGAKVDESFDDLVSVWITREAERNEKFTPSPKQCY